MSDVSCNAKASSASPETCVWPACSRRPASWLNVHLCQTHAETVFTVVNDERQRVARVLVERTNPTPEPAAKPPRVEVIYYLQVGGHIKIGWTGQLEQRMRHYPPNTLLLAVHPGTRADERQLHKRFAVHRSHGKEWYPLMPVILDHINRTVAEHGAPPAISFGARAVKVPTPRPRPTLRAK